MALNRIPFDVWLNIFSYLSLEDRMSCRLVCKLFKEQVNKSLRYVIRLLVLTHKKDDERYNEEVEESFIKAKFLSKPFVKVKTKMNYQDSFFTFIGKFYSNLRVLDAKYAIISLENLHKVTNKFQMHPLESP